MAWQPFSLAPSAPDCSLILLLCPPCPSVGAQCIGERMPVRTKSADKSLSHRRFTVMAMQKFSQHARWDPRHGHAPRVFTTAAAISAAKKKKKEEGKHWRGSSTESKISQDTKTGTFPHPHGTTPDLWLTQMLKLAIMQLVVSPWRSRFGFHSNGGSPLKSSSGARHKERETAREGRWGIMSSCLKWL